MTIKTADRSYDHLIEPKKTINITKHKVQCNFLLLYIDFIVSQ